MPGNGAYVAVSGGLRSGGRGPLFARFECEEPTGAEAPEGVICFRRVRRSEISQAELAEIVKSYLNWDVRWEATERLNKIGAIK